MNVKKKLVTIFIVFISTLLISLAATPQTTVITNTTNSIDQTKTLIKGTWYSPEWEYGFHIVDYKGTITDWNNTYNPQDKNGRGDLVLKIEDYSETGFTATHLFYDGSWIDVTAVIVDKNTLRLSGRREIWEMTRQD